MNNQKHDQGGEVKNDGDINYAIGGKVEGLNIGEAVHLLKQGNKVARVNWNGKGQWLELQVPNEHSKMSLPYVYIRTVQGDSVPWLASQTDLLADDWSIV